MSTPDPAIVAQATGESKPDPHTEPCTGSPTEQPTGPTPGALSGSGSEPPAEPPSRPPFLPPDGPLSDPQSFTIRCAECDAAPGSHLSNCPGVLAAGYDTAGNGAFSSVVYPEAGKSFGKHESAFGALRFYSIWGPVELHLADGRTFSIHDLG